MLKLNADILDQSLAAIKHHGYGDFFPEPPEWRLVEQNWNEVRTCLQNIDLDTYSGYDRIATFAPKSRLNIRRVLLLHPFDLLIFTALVLVLRDDIHSARLPKRMHRLFSYRADNAREGVLYNESPSYGDFKDRVAQKAKRSRTGFVGITDIADFYPRIYQHRLINALQAASKSTKPEHIRVLEKMLSRFSDGASYGIPIGPPASRPLGEAAMIDVDSALMSYGIDFIRFTDDFVIFAAKPDSAEYGIRILAETLFQNHGLTLQTAKTNVLRTEDYLEYHLTPHTEKEVARRKLLEVVGEYDDATSYDDLNEEQKEEVDALNLGGMLREALSADQNVDYREVSFILGRLSALQKPELIPIVLDNLPRLYPVAHSVASFFKQFTELGKRNRENVAKSLLEPILKAEMEPSEYYCIWALSLFHDHCGWNHSQDLLRIFRETNSDTIRRFAALALATSGTRAEAIQTPKHFGCGSALCRTAILFATAKMGTDERKYWKQSQRLTDPLERLCAG